MVTGRAWGLMEPPSAALRWVVMQMQSDAGYGRVLQWLSWIKEPAHTALYAPVCGLLDQGWNHWILGWSRLSHRSG